MGYINSDLIYESKLSITTVDSVHPLQTIEDSPNCVNFQNLSDRNYDVSWKNPAKQTISCAEQYVFRSKWSEVKQRIELKDSDVDITVTHTFILLWLTRVYFIC